MNFAVVQFKDTPKVNKIVPVSKVRESHTNKPFAPRAGQDFANEPYEVKWQKSFDQQDGFSKASVLCLAGTLKGATTKAGEMGLKLTEKDLLDVPSNKDSVTEPPKKESRADRKRKDLSRERDYNPNKKKSKQGNGSKESSTRVKTATVISLERPITEKESAIRPKNKAIQNPAVKERLQNALKAVKAKSVTSGTGLFRDTNNDQDAADDNKSDEDSEFFPEDIRHCSDSPIGKGLRSKKALFLEDDNYDEYTLSRERADTLPITPPKTPNSLSAPTNFDVDSDTDSGSDTEVEKLLKENLTLKQNVEKLRVDLEKSDQSLAKTKKELSKYKELYSDTLAVVTDKQATVDALQKKIKNMRTCDDSEDDLGFDTDEVHVHSKEFHNSQGLNDSNCSNDSSVSKSKLTQRKPKASKVTNPRLGRKIDNKDFPDINFVCNRVLKHLSHEVKLESNEADMIHLGLDVWVPENGFITNFKDNSTDIPKITRNLTTMVWTKGERVTRSLDGTQSQRFKDAAPKKAATPRKINAVVGSVKAHLLKSKTAEGPAMNLALETCRKTIGVKFNEEASLEKRKSRK